MTMICTLCPRRCGAVRTEERGEGFCGMPTLPVVARAALHHWEEPCISGTRGSGAIFFSGCSLRCVFCQNFELSRARVGQEVTPERLAEIFRELEERGADNINLVNPTHYAEHIAEAMDIYRPKIPVVYNTHGYEKLSALELASSFTDIWLPDFKFMDPVLSKRYTGRADYADFARRLPEAFPQTELQEELTLFDSDLTHLPITLTLCHELERLEPYGHGNHKPIFRKDFTLDAANPIGADGSHLRLALRPIEGGNPLKAVWFGNAKAARGWRPGLRLRAWFTLAIDTFREPVPNLILADAQPI